MAVSDTINKVLDFLGFETDPEGDKIFENMMGDAEKYQTDANAALKPIYGEQEKKASKIVPMNRGYEVIVSEPRSYEDSMSILKHLKDRKTVVLNLHLLDKEQALRIVDFLCGASQALDGKQQKIGESVFIFTPANVALSAESQKSKFLRDALWNQPQD